MLVPGVGLEPTRVLPHRSLSPARLPIPPSRHTPLQLSLIQCLVTIYRSESAKIGASFKSSNKAVAMHKLEDYNYHLPEAAIADRPAVGRTQSRLLVMRIGENHFAHQHFADLEAYLKPDDLLVFNNTKVMPARLKAVKVGTGGVGEALVERILSEQRWLCQMRFAHPPRIGTKLRFEPADAAAKGTAVEATVEARRDNLYEIRLLTDEKPLQLLQRIGSVPLPPYIKRAADAADSYRYQTVYAQHYGAVAAPTAGLHFDVPLLEKLQKQGVACATLTLHIGAGTFQPVRTQDIRRHPMHTEHFEIPAKTLALVRATKARGGRAVAVGTTSVRALEATFDADENQCRQGETDIFIYPPYRFRVVDAMITNFHSPQSTLLMLVSAFAGIEPLRAAYQEALAQRYRFLSYGDAMLILPSADSPSPHAI